MTRKQSEILMILV